MTWLVTALLALAIASHSAFADSPGWHTGKVETVWVGMGGVQIVMEPSFREQNDDCGSDFLYLLHTSTPTGTKYRDRATAILTEAMFAQSTVSVYVRELFTDGGERYCRVSTVQARKPRTVSNAGGDGGGSSGGGSVPENQKHVAIYKSSHSNGSIHWTGWRYGSTAGGARSTALSGCRQNDGVRPETCMVVRLMPQENIGKPYCWAYAISESTYMGFGYITNTSNDLATAENRAINWCREYGGSSCEIVKSQCVGVSGSGGASIKDIEVW